MELKHVDPRQRPILAKKFIEEVILPTWKQLSAWNSLTNQTSQLDFGYLSQHLVSLISGIRGTRGRGKGLDLEDGSEVKAASCVDAVDTPRWNAINGTALTSKAMETRLKSIPYFFFVLLDTTERAGNRLRCRIWSVRPADDPNFFKVAMDWAKKVEKGVIKSGKSRPNLQLHPPRWEKAGENITTNECGNLKLPLVYESVQMEVPGILVMETKMYNPKVISDGISQSVEREREVLKNVVAAVATTTLVGGAVALANLRKKKLS
jgi:hypothetical protein